MDFTPLNVAFAILGISLLVIVHEAGHYLAARAFGMRVLRFSIGLGPALWRHKPKDSATTFQVCAIPLLAYVQIDGMNPTEQIDPDDDQLYPNKGVFARIVTIFAGPFANYLAASVMIFGLAQVGGLPILDTTNVVAGVTKGPAQRAKLRPGDRIVRANGETVEDGDDIIRINRERDDQATTYVIERPRKAITKDEVGAQAERVEVTLTPQRLEIAGRERAVIGINLLGQRHFETFPVGESAERAVSQPFVLSAANLMGIARLIEKRNTDDVASVVKMGKILADSIEIAPQAYIWILIQLSIALGLFNLLPFPALDGGRLAFLGYEVITRRRANEKVEAAIHTVGLLFLLGVIALVMVRDVIQLT